VEVGEELGADHDPVAQTRSGLEEVADDLLGVTVGVDVGRVDEVAAAFEVVREQRLGVRRGHAPAAVLAERHGSQAELADP
jgi:hypothetical protein